MAMTNNEGSKTRAEAKQHESILVVGVVGIVDEQGGVVQENGLQVQAAKAERSEVLASQCLSVTDD